ncbi:MAG TPA: methyltransferase domain-containing protein [Pirellulales bacterium]|jgi:phospholipid N-methyltransferase|nr:methyltransferase domain-containing protein [Pirellulales bacterium]
MAGLLSDYRVFVRQFFRRYHTTGAILPSGRRLASALCHYVGESDGLAGRQILEVGPGTGAVTARLVEVLRPDDDLTLVELNDEFVQHLQTRFASEPGFRAVAGRTQIIHSRLEELAGERRYDRIISGLPLNNFAAAEVEQILGVFGRLLKAGGILSFFEYIAIRRVKVVISGRAERQRLREIGRLLGDLFEHRQIRCDAVWPNVTPAWVHHVRFADAPEDGVAIGRPAR